MKYIDAEKLIAEIERLAETLPEVRSIMEELLSFIDSLQQEQPAEWNDTDMKEARDNLISVCRDWEFGKQTTLLPIVAIRARYFLEHLAEPKPAEWSEEDKLSTELDDWSSFRREAAKDILCALVGNKDYLKVIGRIEPETMLAIRFADELTKQLKEETK